jgi:mannitol-specific phosphotransferase system IIBC component
MASSIPAANVDRIIFACEAGIGSSLMGVNALKKKLQSANLKVAVEHKAARAVPADAKVVVTHKGLANLVRNNVPNAVVVTFSQFLNDPAFDRLVNQLKNDEAVTEG